MIRCRVLRVVLNLFRFPSFRHPFPSTHSYAIITEFIENEQIEMIFDEPAMHKVYMRDLLAGLQHLHARQIIFRDVKPSNCLLAIKRRQDGTIDAAGSRSTQQHTRTRPELHSSR